MLPNVEVRFELIGVAQADRAVHSVPTDKKITSSAQRFEILDLGAEVDLDAELFRSPLQDFQQPQACDTGKAVAVNRDLLVAMNDIDVVPRFELFRDLRV